MNRLRLLNLLLVAAMLLTMVGPALPRPVATLPDRQPPSAETSVSPPAPTLAAPQAGSFADIDPAVGSALVPDLDTTPSPASSARIDHDWGQLPLYFVENQGQMDERVAYYLQGSDKTLYFASTGVTFALTAPVTDSVSSPSSRRSDGLAPASLPARQEPQPAAVQRWAVKLDFVGANPDVRPMGEDRTEAVISYFRGSPDEWNAGLPTYSRIVYRDLWPGIDLVYYGTVNQLKYEFIVQPGADPDQIRLAYRGVTDVTLNTAGQLEVTTPVGGFQDDTPVAYQNINGQRVPVSMAYAIDESDVNSAGRLTPSDGDSSRPYGFAIGPYDPIRPLVLDPAWLVYCGYIGGSRGEEIGRGIAVDSAGNAYVTGYTRSDQTSFPVTVGPDLTYNGGVAYGDAFVAKVNAAGTALLYAGYIGGSSEDVGEAIAVDSAGNAYVTGRTWSDQTSFPVTVGPDLTFNGMEDAFVAKVNAAGTALVYAGYIGGTDNDWAHDVAVDSAGNAYVTGDTDSDETSFPVTGGPDLIYNTGGDAFVAKVNTAGTGLVYAGYIGGWGAETGWAIAVDSVGIAYVTGYTTSPNQFPVTVGPDLTYNGGNSDAFVAKVNVAGTTLAYAGYIGGSGGEAGYGIAVDSAGNVYVTGYTDSDETSFPVTSGPDLTYNGGGIDAFVAKVNAAGTALAYAGYIGGSMDDVAWDIAVDGARNAYVTGQTYSDQATFPVTVWLDPTHNGGRDAFVAKINAAGTVLIYSGYIGGSMDDSAEGISVDGAGNAYVTGRTRSNQATFPVLNGPDLSIGGYQDSFVAKITFMNCDQLLDAGRHYRLDFHQSSGVTLGYTQTIAALQQQQSLDLLNRADRCYRRLISAQPSNSLAQTGLLDTRWEVATAYLLGGNDLMVQALDVESSSPYDPLPEEIGQLDDALEEFTLATSSYTDLLASEFYTSFMTLQLTRTNPLTGDVTPYLDVQRLAIASAQKSRAYVEKAERQFRLFTPAEREKAMQTLRHGMSAAVSEAALLRTLWEPIKYDVSYQAILRNMADMQRIYRYLQTGKNPFGYSADHVPFHVDPDRLPANNFEQTMTLAQGEWAVARDLADNARGWQEQIENNYNLLQQNLQSAIANYNAQLLGLCGPNANGQPDFENCHTNTAGEIYAQLLRIDAARLRIDLVQQQMANQLALIDIEQQRAARVEGIQRATAEMILDTGEKLAILAKEEATLRQRGTWGDYVGAILSGATRGIIPGKQPVPFDPWGTAAGAVLGGLSVLASQLNSNASQLGDIAAKREGLIAKQNAAVHYAEAEITDANSEALIKQYMLRFTEYDIELSLAANNLQQELTRLNGLKAQAEYLAAEKAKAVAFNIALFRDPAHRVMRDYTMELANDRFDVALRYAWEAGRALEYEMNQDARFESGPLTDLDSLYRVRDVHDLQATLAQMNTAYNDFRGDLPPPQKSTTHIFLSQALGFEDAFDRDLKRTVTREEKFNAFVRDRAHWVDLDGDSEKESLRFTFQTSIFVGNRFFSSYVFNDKILSIKTSIYGNGLGDDQAAILLELGGTSFIRTADAFSTMDPGGHPIDEVREYNTSPLRARVTAIVDRPPGAGDAADYQLTSRSVAYTNWTLTLPKYGEPINSDINIDNIQDIQLDIEHEACTLQTLRAQARAGGAQPQFDPSLFEPPPNRPYRPIQPTFRLEPQSLHVRVGAVRP